MGLCVCLAAGFGDGHGLGMIFRGLAALAEVAADLHLAIGVFDGVHQGHRAVIESACQLARVEGGVAVVVTFDPHPVRVLAPERAPRMLASLEHQQRILQDLGVENLLVLPFDAALAGLEAREFVAGLVGPAGGRVKSISVGEDWRFGARAAGDVVLLRQLGLEWGFRVFAVERVRLEGQRVSSTEIRAAIQAGDLARASRLLGRPWTVFGTVIQGRQLGRQLGFPTANLRVHAEQLPPSGVYAVRARLADGRRVGGVANLGLRPTVEAGETQRRLEVHLFDFNEDLYDQALEVEFLRLLRLEQAFENLEALKAQIGRDVALAREILAESAAG